MLQFLHSALEYANGFLWGIVVGVVGVLVYQNWSVVKTDVQTVQTDAQQAAQKL